MKYKFDINSKYFYEHSKPELKERTKQRLTEMAELGIEETGNASFGYKNVMSGLYIEKVWSYSDEDFKDYMDWVRKLIKNYFTFMDTDDLRLEYNKPIHFNCKDGDEAFTNGYVLWLEHKILTINKN